MKKIVKKLIEKYGENEEKRKICEELSELLVNVIKSLNGKDISRRDILEERIDVELELHMIDEIYGFNEITKDKMWEIKKKKIEERYLKKR